MRKLPLLRSRAASLAEPLLPIGPLLPVDVAPVDAVPVDVAPVDVAPVDATPVDPLAAAPLDGAPLDPVVAPPLDGLPLEGLAPPDEEPLVGPAWVLPPPHPTSTAAPKKAAPTLRLMFTVSNCTMKRFRAAGASGRSPSLPVPSTSRSRHCMWRTWRAPLNRQTLRRKALRREP
jgi:hypothetical protein